MRARLVSVASPVRLPPLEYLLIVDCDDEGEPRKDQRAALDAMATAWNGSHQAQFTWEEEPGMEMLSVVLPLGADDPQRPALMQHLEALERATGLTASCGIEGPSRTAADHVRADFVGLSGEATPPGFAVNLFATTGPGSRCPACGRPGSDADRPWLRSLAIDLASLGEHNRPPIVSVGPRCLVSTAVVERLAAIDAQGYTTHDVLDASTGQVCDAYRLLRASVSWPGLCTAHTPFGAPRCETCGHGAPPLGHPHVPRASLGHLDVVSTHAEGFANLYVSRRVFASLQAAELAPDLVLDSFDLCDCPGAPPPSRPVHRQPETPVETASVDALLSFVHAPSPLAQLQRCGPHGDTVTRPLMHRFGAPASPLALTALQARHPEVAQLRTLAERLDGIEFFSPRLPERALPSLDEARMDPGAALRIERAADWPRLREEMQAWAADLEDPLVPHDGLPFATIPASSDLLVLFEGRVYYVSPLYAGPHNQVVAESLEALFGIIVHDLARFTMETASVVRYYDEGDQFYPVAFVSTP